MEGEITFYKFLSEIRAFLSKLIKDPIHAKSCKFLDDLGLEKKTLINLLIKKDIIERHEKILDSTNSDEKKPKYTVTYKVKKKDFNNRIHSLYNTYCKENNKKNLNEEEGGGAMGGAIGGGATNSLGGTSSFSVGQHTSRGDDGYDELLANGVQRRPMPTQIKESRRIYVTEEQYKKIKEATATTNVGAMGDYTAGGLQISSDDPTVKGRKIKLTKWH